MLVDALMAGIPTDTRPVRIRKVSLEISLESTGTGSYTR